MNEKYAQVVKLDHETLGIGVKIPKNMWNHHLVVLDLFCFDSGKFSVTQMCHELTSSTHVDSWKNLSFFVMHVHRLDFSKGATAIQRKNTHFQKAVWQKKSARLKEKKAVDASHKMVDWNLNMSTWKDGMFQDSRLFFQRCLNISTPSTHGFLHGVLFFFRWDPPKATPTEWHPQTQPQPPNSLTHETPSLAPEFRLQHQMRQHRGTLWICFLVFFLVPRIAVCSQLFGDGIWLVEDASQTWHLATFMWSAMSFDTRWFTPYLQKRSKTRSSISWLRILREACGAQQLKHFALN